MAARVCLNMIVKNEAAILARCLHAAAPYIDCWVICDTGSTDDTVSIVERVMQEHRIPGQLVHTTFANFEQARNEALDAALSSALEFDYLLLCDADMELRVEDAFFRESLTEPVYHLVQRNSLIAYQNVRLLRRGCLARYRGVTHEYLDTGHDAPAFLDAAWFYDHAEGSSRAVKFARDIALLEEAVGREPDNPRNVFYLAQSYGDAGDAHRALETYQQRIAMGGWDEEVWYSMLRVAHFSAVIGLDPAVVVHRYLAAYQFRPQRAEPLVALARFHRTRGEYQLAHLVADRARQIPRPDDRLFLDESVYAWGALDEFALAAYWTGRHRDSADIWRQLLATDVLSNDDRDRVDRNLRFALAQ